ncbi:MAG: hypothetical protein ABIO06_09865 [Pseudolysinimonas sp.]
MDLLERALPLPLAAAHPGVAVLALHGRLWRATRADGAVLGYVELFDTPEGERFLSKRLRPRAQGFLPVGEFWTADEAIESLRG